MLHHRTLTLTNVDLKGGEGDQVTLTGLAADFTSKDLGGDRIKEGAFTKDLQTRGNVRPLTADHSFGFDGRLGLAWLQESERGLELTKGLVNTKKQFSRDVVSDIEQALSHDVPMGMSIGFQIPRGGMEYDEVKDARLITEIKLWEVTVTQFPMNPKAHVSHVKSFDEILSRFERDMASLAAATGTEEEFRTLTTKIRSALTGDEGEARIAKMLRAFANQLHQ